MNDKPPPKTHLPAGERDNSGRRLTPADPIARAEPLPWERPKPDVDDPKAAIHLQTILDNDSSLRATEDPRFLRSDALRGVRLEIEYLKPELTLRDAGIAETIVVFGSSRIPEPIAARRELEEARKRLTESGSSDPVSRRRVEIAERILEKSRYYDIAREFGRLVSAADWAATGSRAVIMTGGGPGIMEATNRGAFDVGAESIGLNIELPRGQFPNPYVTPGLCFNLDYFAIRKLHLVKRARALVAFPGGFGTMDELFETLTLAQTRKIKPIPVVLVGEEFWRGAVDFDFLVNEGVVDAEDIELFQFAESADEIWQAILRWHEAAGTPLIPAAAPNGV